jgi:hypothetical protein
MLPVATRADPAPPVAAGRVTPRRTVKQRLRGRDNGAY